MTRGKLILMGDGKVVYVPPQPLTPSMAEMIKEEFKRWSADPASILAIMGQPVEIIDNRPQEPRTIAEVVLREGADAVDPVDGGWGEI